MPSDAIVCHLTRQELEARKFATVGELASGITHEINTPIQYIGDNLRFLLDAFRQLAALLPASPESAAGVSVDLAYLLDEIPSAITQSLDGIAQVCIVVDAMKRFATATVGEIAAVDLNRLIESVVTLARNEWKYTGDVVCALDPALPPVPCAEAEMRQLVLGLVIGAARAWAGRGETCRITVATRRDGDWAELAVQGLADAERGLGCELSFARAIAAAHRGAVRAVPSVDGTAVTVRLPLRRQESTTSVTSATDGALVVATGTKS
jgi:nitrogen-specific signal transduction histidine kinase